MAQRIAAWVLASVLFLAGASQAQEFDNEGSPASVPMDDGAGHCLGRCHGRGLHRRNDDGRTCCQRLWDWWTYRPLPVPHEMKVCIRFQQTPQPANYAYFVYLYGPRTPALGYKPVPVQRGEVMAHCLPIVPELTPHGMPVDGMPFDGVPDGAVPEEGLPAPRPQGPPGAKPGALPDQAPEESELSAVPVRDTSGNGR